MSVKRQEELLKAWIRMSICIRGNRILEEISMNEMIICNMLFQRHQEGKEPLTATELCEQTRLLKSQINKILSEMEHRNLIRRIRSSQDKRKVYIRLHEDNIQAYLAEHQRVMKVMEAIADGMGEEKLEQLTQLIHQATQIVDGLQKEEMKI